MTVYVTRHAYDQAKDRCGFSRNTVTRMAQRAFDEGVKQGDLVGSLRKYVDAQYFKHKTANNIRIYGLFVWIFESENLITVFHVPARFRRAAIHAGKKHGKV